MWLSPEVEITLVTHWDRPLGNSHPPVANQRSIRRLVVQACHNQVFGSQVITGGPIASNWAFMSCELCLVFVSDSSFLSSLDISQSDYGRFVRILQVMSFSHWSRYEHKQNHRRIILKCIKNGADLQNTLYNYILAVLTFITSSHGNVLAIRSDFTDSCASRPPVDTPTRWWGRWLCFVPSGGRKRGTKRWVIWIDRAAWSSFVFEL